MIDKMAIFLALIALFSGMAAPPPYNAIGHVLDTQDDVITVNVDGEVYAFYGDGFSVGDVLAIALIDGELTDAECVLEAE